MVISDFSVSASEPRTYIGQFCTDRCLHRSCGAQPRPQCKRSFRHEGNGACRLTRSFLQPMLHLLKKTACRYVNLRHLRAFQCLYQTSQKLDDEFLHTILRANLYLLVQGNPVQTPHDKRTTSITDQHPSHAGSSRCPGLTMIGRGTLKGSCGKHPFKVRCMEGKRTNRRTSVTMAMDRALASRASSWQDRAEAEGSKKVCTCIFFLDFRLVGPSLLQPNSLPHQ